VWGFDAEPIVPPHMKNLSLNDFKQMLSYTDEAAAGAVTAMGVKQEYGAVPELIRLLDDTRPFRRGRNREPTSMADVSKTALTQIIRGRISSEPENIGLLLPYLTAASEGSLSQRKAVIEILGEIREPLATPLLSDSSRNNDPQISEAATKALTEVNSSEMENRGYSSLRRSQRAYVLGSLLLICLLVAWVIDQLISGADKPLVLLSAVPVVLLGGMSWVLANDFREGTVTNQRIDTAVARGNIEALRAMNYHDYTVYPGDSKVARSLISLRDDNVIRDLLLLPTVQAVDDTSFTEVVDKRVRWILARIVASKLGTPGMNELIANNDPQVKIAVARVLGKLMVRNDSIIEALTLLSKDEDEQVRQIATGVLPQVRRYPVWPGSTL
jgi:HEAT repeat protein